MAEVTTGWKVTISADNMVASLNIDPPGAEVSYSTDDAVAFLRKNGVNNGILYSEVENMIHAGVYYRDVVVAKGRDPINGVEGSYDLYFDTTKRKKPQIRPDGSVDYQSMKIVQSVKKGDVLAVYHSAVAGTHGYDVRGRELRCKPGRELPPLKGVGFELGLDQKTYIASMDGRVEYDNYKLFIRDTYEHKGDLDQLTGRIDFRGDVVITGNVCTGTTVRASKTITVEGSVEAATLIAEGDIVIKKGMQGGGRSRVVSGGSVYANFLEFTEVEAKNDIEANIALNCRMKAGRHIKISGTKGSIVGGITYATGLINTSNLGNKAEVKTRAAVGVSADMRKRYELLKDKAQRAKDSVEETKRAIEKTKDIRLSQETKEVREAKVNQLQRRLNRDERLFEHVSGELSKIEEIIGRGSTACIQVERVVNGGVTIAVDEKETVVSKPVEHVEYYHSLDYDAVMTRTL